MGEPIPIVIEKGRLLAVYDDCLMPYIERLVEEFGLPADSVEVFRASHVEPMPGGPDRKSRWYVDLSPMDGPQQDVDEAGDPFATRSAALAFERRWLIKNWLKSSLNGNKDVGVAL